MIKNEDFFERSRRRRSFGRFYFDSDNKLIRKIHLLFEIGALVAFRSKTSPDSIIQVRIPCAYFFPICDNIQEQSRKSSLN